MRDPVCIVLNERESSKARAAELLQEALKGLNITSSRIEISDSVAVSLVSDKPSVVVLDYLLGDITTGLDVATRLAELPEERRPTIFFLTDEPSVPVAVEAMRLGARNYFEIDNPQAVLKLSREIAQAVVAKRTAIGHERRQDTALKLDDLVAQCDESRRVIDQARALLVKRPPVIGIYGSSGTGKSTLAHALQMELSRAAATSQNQTSKKKNELPSVDNFLLKTIDLGLCIDPLTDVLGLHSSALGPRAFFELVAIIEHADSDNGELLELVSSVIPKLPDKRRVKAPLIICFDSSETVRAWHRVIDSANFLALPDLAERSRDIPALVQKFSIEAAELSGEKVPQLDASLIDWIASLAWEDNCKQLKSVVIDALLSTKSKPEDIKSRIEDARTLWTEMRAVVAAPPLTPLSAALALEISNHNYRIAAARLGTTPQSLYHLIHGA